MIKKYNVILLIILAVATVVPIFYLDSPANARSLFEMTEVVTLPSPSSSDGSCTAVGSLVINMLPERAVAANGLEFYLRLPAGYKLDVNTGGISAEGQDSGAPAIIVTKKNDFDSRVNLTFENMTPAPGTSIYRIKIPLQIYIPSGINDITYMVVFAPTYTTDEVIVARSSGTTSSQSTELTTTQSAGSTYRMTEVMTLPSPSSFDRSHTSVGSLVVNMAPDTAKAANGLKLYLSLPNMYELDADTDAITVAGQESGAPAVSATKKNETLNAVVLTFNNMTPAQGASTYQIEIPLRIFIPIGIEGNTVLEIAAPSSSKYSSGQVVAAYTKPKLQSTGQVTEPTTTPSATQSAGSSYSMTQVVTLPSPSSSDGSSTAIGSLVVSMSPDTARAANGLKLWLSLPSSPAGYKLNADIDSVRAEGQDSSAPAVYATKRNDDPGLILTFNNMAPASGAGTYRITIPLQIYVPGGVGGDIRMDIAVPSSSKYSSDQVVVARSSGMASSQPTEQEPTDSELINDYSMTEVVTLPSPSTSDGSSKSIGSLVIKMNGAKAAAANEQYVYLSLPSTPAGYKLHMMTESLSVEGQVKDHEVDIAQTPPTAEGPTVSLFIHGILPVSAETEYKIVIPMRIYIPDGVTDDTVLYITAPPNSPYASGSVVVVKSNLQTETESMDTEPSSQTTTTQPSDQPAQEPTVMHIAIGSTDYHVNDQLQTMDTAAVIKEGRTLMPIRYIATPLGASVDWKAEEKKAVIALNGTTIELKVGENNAMVNGVETLIDPSNMNVSTEVAPPGRIILPLRFVAENLGCKVDWDPEQQTVTVTGPKP